VKHRFTEERFAERYAVDSAGQFAVEPGLHRVGITQIMEIDISLLHFGSDPGAVLANPWHGSASSDHFIEGSIYRNLKNTFSERPF
jgi:hypothetical protein